MTLFLPIWFRLAATNSKEFNVIQLQFDFVLGLHERFFSVSSVSNAIEKFNLEEDKKENVIRDDNENENRFNFITFNSFHFIPFYILVNFLMEIDVQKHRIQNKGRAKKEKNNNKKLNEE